MRHPDADRSVHALSDDTTTGRHLDGHRDDENPGAISGQPGLLVHGERRAYRFCNVLLTPLSDFRRWRSLVARCAARPRKIIQVQSAQEPTRGQNPVCRRECYSPCRFPPRFRHRVEESCDRNSAPVSLPFSVSSAKTPERGLRRAFGPQALTIISLAASQRIYTHTAMIAPAPVCADSRPSIPEPHLTHRLHAWPPFHTGIILIEKAIVVVSKIGRAHV